MDQRSVQRMHGDEHRDLNHSGKGRARRVKENDKRVNRRTNHRGGWSVSEAAGGSGGATQMHGEEKKPKC